MRVNWCCSLWALALLSACQAKAEKTSTPAVLAVPAHQPASALGSKPQIGRFGVDLDEREPSVKPGDDFYRYVNGKWLDSYQLKSDEMRYGAFVELAYQSEDLGGLSLAHTAFPRR